MHLFSFRTTLKLNLYFGLKLLISRRCTQSFFKPLKDLFGLRSPFDHYWPFTFGQICHRGHNGDKAGDKATVVASGPKEQPELLLLTGWGHFWIASTLLICGLMSPQLTLCLSWGLLAIGSSFAPANTWTHRHWPWFWTNLFAHALWVSFVAFFPHLAPTHWGMVMGEDSPAL